MGKVEVVFPIIGLQMPSDHAYLLYSAICHWVSSLHAPESPILMGPVAGRLVGNGLMELDPRRSRLPFRLPGEAIPSLLVLTGKTFPSGKPHFPWP